MYIPKYIDICICRACARLKLNEDLPSLNADDSPSPTRGVSSPITEQDGHVARALTSSTLHTVKHDSGWCQDDERPIVIQLAHVFERLAQVIDTYTDTHIT